MSLTPLQRATLAWSSRPPGPASLWYAVGTAVRQIGAQIDAFGMSIQGDSATKEKLPIPTTAVAVDGKSPSLDAANFVAPSANLIGAVTMGRGASAWYGASILGTSTAVEIGELSTIGDCATVVDSVVGKHVHVGAGARVTAATLGDESSVGMGSIVGKGAKLGKGAALAAGSVLAPGAQIPANELWGGHPAKKVGDVDAAAMDGRLRAAAVTAELGQLHMDEAWKALGLVEQVRVPIRSPCSLYGRTR